MDLSKTLRHYNEKVKFFYECLSLFIIADSDGVDVNIDENVKEQLIKALDSCRKVYGMTLDTEILYEYVINEYYNFKNGLSSTYVIDHLIYKVADSYFKGEEYEEN